VQNAEQGNTTIWARIQDRVVDPDVKTREQLYIEYSKDQFKGLEVNKDLEPELYNFVEDIKQNGARFYGYTPEQIEHFAKRIYELRKYNTNNAT